MECARKGYVSISGYKFITRIWLSNSVRYQRGVTSSRDEIRQRLEGSQVQVHGG
jgi:hypothetical protein